LAFDRVSSGLLLPGLDPLSEGLDELKKGSLILRARLARYAERLVEWLLFAPQADDVAVRVADGSPVAHSAADSLAFLQYSSA
jgi:hypothetical protein